MIEASLLVVTIVALLVGGLTGIVLGTTISGIAVALAAGFLGVIAATIARNVLVRRAMRVGPDDSGLPVVVIVFSVVASIAGSLAAAEITETIPISTGMLGALSGLLSGMLMAMLMITYHMNPDKRRNLIKN